MRALTEGELVAAWEAGHGRHALDRALILARTAAPELGWEDLSRLPIGERDRLLLALREAISGERLPCYIACPECGADLELSLRTADLRTTAEAAGNELAWEEYVLRVRAPDSLDLAAVARTGSQGAGLRALLGRCVEARRGDEPIDAASLPGPLIDAIADRIAALDPDAEIVLRLACIDCHHTWSALFDIAEYLWSEVVTRAHGLLREIDVLARAYGWSETEILSLGATRRRAYLELALS